MEVATLLAFYILGLLTGAVGAITFTIYMGKRLMDKRQDEGKKVESIGSRMKRVKDLTTEQLDLQGQVSGPQKNALHGKYKNGLIGRIKELEEQKTEILKSIITDGFDPELTVMDNAGVVSTIKLSEYLAQTGITIPPKNPSPSTKQIGKFTVHKGGKDDGGTTH